MPVLTLLPIELLRNIFSFLDTPTLRKVIRVSPFFAELAEPFLYATLGGYRTWLLETLSALVTRPELIRHVRKIEFSWWNEHYPSTDNCELFSATAAAMGVPDNGWWIDAQALFLLHLVPDVREISIDDAPALTSMILNTMHTPQAFLPFKSLVKFDCAQSSEGSFVTPTLLLCLMRIPTLRHITADMQGADYHDEPTDLAALRAFAGQANTTHLSLYWGNTTASVLALILALPRALQEFSYADNDEYWYDPDATTTVAGALECVRGSLRAVTFGQLHALYLGTPHAQTIGCFADWPVLTDVTCSMPGILGPAEGATRRLVDVLPRGLRRLEIRRKDKRREGVKWRQRWSVELMTEMVLEVMCQRRMEKVTVDTCASVYRKDHWVNEFDEKVRRTLEAAVGTGLTKRCKIDCF